MAFLCPALRKSKKKVTNANIERDLPVGRITGSASIETLVRVGIEKEHGLSPDSKMMVLHDFTPCVDDELEVKRGQIVNILYRENDWVYVIGQDSRQEGFIPYSYCVQFNGQLTDLSLKKKLPREQQNMEQKYGENVQLLGAIDVADDGFVPANGVGVSSAEPNIMLQPECTLFQKEPSGRYIALYTFIARDENDISLERGEFVTVLNHEDVDWFWIVRDSDGQEGFVPSAFIYPADSVLQTHQKMVNAETSPAVGINNGGGIMSVNDKTGNLIRNLNRLAQRPVAVNQNDPTFNSIQQQDQTQQMTLSAEDLRFHGTELVMLYDYKATQAPDDLSLRRGEWIYADLNNQTVDGWLWAYARKSRKYGFIPKAYARPQPQTQL